MFFSALCVGLFLFTEIDLLVPYYPESEFTTAPLISVVGVVTYDNADTQKEKIYKENRPPAASRRLEGALRLGKVGVYR